MDLTIDAQRILQELACIGFAKVTDYLQIKDGQLLIQDTQQLPEAIAQARSTQFGVYHSQRQQVLTTIRDFLGTL